MKAKTSHPIEDETGKAILPAGPVGRVVRVVRDETYGDDLVLDFGPKGEFRIPAEDCEQVQ